MLSDRATAWGANWAESRMANLAGQFAGIVHLQVPDANVDALSSALRELESLGLKVIVTRCSPLPVELSGRLIKTEIVGQDRPGIVRDISRILADRHISIESLDTEFVSGSWSGENLFETRAKLRVPLTITTDELRHVLEGLADALVVDVVSEDTVTQTISASE